MNRTSLDPMDRPLEPGVVKRRRRKRIIQIGAACCAVAGGFALLSAMVTPSVSKIDLRTAMVDSGSVEASISATGTVVPEYEEAISSPAETRVLRVLKRPGERLSKGEQFLELDVSGPTLAMERIQSDLTLKANQAEQLKLDRERSLDDLRNQLRIKGLRLTYLKSKSAQEEKMYAIGASSKDQLDQAKLEEEIATTEQAGLEASIRNAAQSLSNELGGLATGLATLRKERADMQRRLDILSCRSPRPGVVTMVAQDVGAVLHAGDIIARVSDLNTYRVEAEISDIHAGTLAAGQRTRVSWTGGAAEGTVAEINPTIEQGTIRFSIALDRKSDPRLRSNLRVDVAVITAEKGMSLRVAAGPSTSGSGARELFLVRGERGIRTTATIGVSGIDYVQVLGGLAKGDEVVITDMREYLHAREIRLK